MALIQLSYTWPEGGSFAVTVSAKARNVEALADMRIEAERLWTKGLAEPDKIDGAGEVQRG
jgi:hypothetical protein